MSVPLRVLIVEDSEDDTELLLRQLRLGGFEPDWLQVDSAPALTSALEGGPWDLVIADYALPGFGGIEALQILKDRGLDVPFILVSGRRGEELAVEAMNAGAHDYLMKGTFSRLVPAIRRELSDAQVRREHRSAQDALTRAYSQLERRIEARTVELTRANERLKEEILERQRAQEERERLSAELLQGQKLQAIGQLSAGIAHEINNPLGFMLSNLATLEEYLESLAELVHAALPAPGDPGRAPATEASRLVFERVRSRIDPDFLLRDFSEALRECRQGGERIRTIVRNLREFTHVDEHQLKCADFNQLVEDALRLCSNELRYKAEVKREFGTLPPIRCYPQQIVQVFVNLLVNAAQAIPEKGTISVTTGVEADRAVVRIRDTGVGIPPEHLGKLFEPFFTTKPIGTGTGLGLHLAYNIVKSHEGRIEAHSRVGEGTEFRVQVPVHGPGKQAG
jgi:two-component system NtrC family sensor kinase